ncbi:MAG: hypothetical protein OEN55_05885 [Alphaproteobacteria bacterium]|nr:hypothetical protein [Alphaproteobacteria bacterium]
MITLSAKITGLIVTTSMGLFLTAVAILCVVPLVQAIVERRRPEMPDLPAIIENLGVALAIGGLTFRVTEAAAIGVALALLGAVFAFTRRTGVATRDPANGLHPFLQKAMLVCGVVSLGVLGEYYYLVS